MKELNKNELIFLSNLVLEEISEARRDRMKFETKELKESLSVTEEFLEEIYQKLGKSIVIRGEE